MSTNPAKAFNDPTELAGNVSSEVKEMVSTMWANMIPGNEFGHSVGRQLSYKEISFIEKAEEPQRMEGRVVVEVVVKDGKKSSPHLFGRFVERG